MTSSNGIAKEDVKDTDFVDAEELASDGYFVYRTVSLVSTTSLSRTVTISVSNIFDRLDNVDAPLQVGDRIEIYGNAAAGFYTVESIPTATSFVVIQSIADSTLGSADFIHPAGALKVGFDSTQVTFTDKSTVQEALEDLDGYIGLRSPNDVGQLLFAIAADKFSVAMPVTSNQGWLVNDQGILLVNQVYPDDPIE